MQIHLKINWRRLSLTINRVLEVPEPNAEEMRILAGKYIRLMLSDAAAGCESLAEANNKIDQKVTDLQMNGYGLVGKGVTTDERIA